MWPFVALAGLLALIIGAMSVVYPLRFLRIQRRTHGLVLAIAGIVVMIIAGINLPDEPGTKRATASSVTPEIVNPQPVTITATQASPAPPQPLTEQAFIAAVQGGRDAYRAGGNDFQKGAARPARAKAICAAVPSKVDGWVGKLTNLSTNGDGKGVISIEIAKDIAVSTWNNEISDITHKTLISPNSQLFQVLATLSEGDAVSFSGYFMRSETDCVNEQSITMHGSMTDPVFTFRFSSIRKL